MSRTLNGMTIRRRRVPAAARRYTVEVGDEGGFTVVGEAWAADGVWSWRMFLDSFDRPDPPAEGVAFTLAEAVDACAQRWMRHRRDNAG